MNAPLVATVTTVASAPATLTILIAGTLLVSLRVWTRVRALELAPRVVHTLDAAVVVLGVLFLLLVVIRFKTLA